MSQHMHLTPCMVGSMIGDEIPYVCENDMLGLLVQRVLADISSSTCSFCELYEYYPDALLVGVCGYLPPSFAKGGVRVRAFESELFQGLGACSVMKEGNVTLVRLAYDRYGKAIMQIIEGEGKVAPLWREAIFPLPQHPSLMITPYGDIKNIVNNLLAQHFAIVYGLWGSALHQFCRITGIEVL